MRPRPGRRRPRRRRPRGAGCRGAGRRRPRARGRRWRCPPDLRAGAFFDVDNTIMRGASIFHLARGLYKRDFFTLKDILGFAWQQLSFLARGENLEHVDQIQARALSFVAGHSVAELSAVGEEVFDEIMVRQDLAGHEGAGPDAPGRRPAGLARDRDAGRGRGGHRPPAGPDRRRSAPWRSTWTASTPAASSDRCCTGRRRSRPSARWPSGRAWTWPLCSAYSDSANDIPLLSLVGTPVRDQPGRQAARRTRRRRAGASGTTAPAGRRPGSASRRRRSAGARRRCRHGRGRRQPPLAGPPRAATG